MKNSLTRRIGALLGAGAVALAGFAFAGSAAAESTSTDATNIPTAKSTLTITKYDFGTSGAPTNLAHNGTEVTSGLDGYKTLKNVKFKISKVKKDGAAIDLNTQAGWDAAKGLFKSDGTVNWNGTAPALPTGYTAEAVSAPVLTNASGVAEWTELDHTVYLVEEVASTTTDPKITDSDNKEVTVQSVARPFLVTLPLANNSKTGVTAENRWINHVYVYPKNNTIDSKGTKTAEFDKAYINNLDVTDKTTVTWTVTARTPVKMETLDGISLVDTLPAGVTLAMKEDGTPDASVTIDGANKTDAFTISGNVNFTLNGANQTERLGALKISAPSDIQGKDVVFKFKVTIDPKQFTSNTMTNIATATINGTPVIASTGDGSGSEDGDGSDTTPLFAKVTLTKKDAKDSSVLEGAQFTIYEATETTGTPATPNTDKRIGVFTTDAQGKLDVRVYLGTIKEAHATNTEVNTAAEVKKNVCIVETKALVGYDKDSFETQCFTLTGGTTDAQAIEATNVKTGDSWTAGLPLTGAQGLVVLSIGGVVLLAAGIFAIAAVRRRQKQD